MSARGSPITATHVVLWPPELTLFLLKSPAQLRELYPRLLSHSTLCFGAREVMNFLGRPLHPLFQGEVVSDVCDLSFKRISGAGIKHRVKQNWLKMYDKAVRSSVSKWGSMNRRDPKSESKSFGKERK
jgi:hypothetical protein